MALSLTGWRFEGAIPNVAKGVIIVGPHTSNWDFLLGVAAMFALGLRVSWLGKHTVFRRPFGPLMRWLGGIAIDRRASVGVVEQIIATFDARDSLILGLSPEGTRSRVKRWKTGFYHIALGAGVPIIPVAFDYSAKVVNLGEGLAPTGDLEADIEVLRLFLARAVGKRPELACTSAPVV